jgi:His-Xaa-Ser system radical SAM maturase HxsC
MIQQVTYGKPTQALQEPVLGRVTKRALLNDREDAILLIDGREENDFHGYAGVLSTKPLPPEVPAVASIASLSHLENGDVVHLLPTGMVRTLYRRSSRHNVLFATDRCNSLCLMCSQPPREVDERGLVSQHIRLINLIDPTTAELGITGGEPTLLAEGEGFLRVLDECKRRLPQTKVHVLTNGRAFKRREFVREFAELGHPHVVLGIPLYADVASIHDYVVQAEGAFDETMIGLHHLGTFGVAIEIRVVVHKLTYQRLLPLSEFLYRNVPFAIHVAMMGLEMIGFAVTNKHDLWIDPITYQDHLAAAVHFLAARGVNVSIYNHQLCTLPNALWPYARQSISDWKNEYLPICNECSIKGMCGGFFAWNIQHGAVSSRIQPICGSAASFSSSMPV